MKLLTVNMTLDPVSGGGCAARTLMVSRVLADRGISCAIATSDEGLDRVRDQVANLTVVSLPVVGGRFRVPVGGRAALRRAVEAADVVMLVNHWTVINLLAWRAAVLAGTPWVVCPAGSLSIEGRSRLLKRFYNVAGGRRIVAEAHGHIAVTAQEADHYRRYGIDPGAVTVIPNGMPPPRAGDGAAFRARHGLGGGPLLLFVGRLAPLKGPDLLIGAFMRCQAALPDWQLVIGGPDDGMGARLQAQVAKAGIGGRVHFTGFLDDQSRADAIASAAAVVVPSRREAMSVIVLEAAGGARPVLVTDQCGIPEVAEWGGGWVVEATETGLADGLMTVASQLAQLDARGATWQRAASAHFHWDVVGRQYVDLFESILARAAR